MKLNYSKWRQKAYEMLKEKGEMTIHIMMDNIGYMRFAPRNVNAATQLLLKDKRFTSRKVEKADMDLLPRTTDSGRYKVLVWGVRSEN